jgi:hypothetical protein
MVMPEGKALKAFVMYVYYVSGYMYVCMYAGINVCTGRRCRCIESVGIGFVMCVCIYIYIYIYIYTYGSMDVSTKKTVTMQSAEM